MGYDFAADAGRRTEATGLQGSPAEGILRPVPRARARPRARAGLRGGACADRAPRPDQLPGARVRERERAERAGDPRAQPRLVHGPFLHRRVRPPARAVHGQVAAVQQRSARLGLQPRRRVPGSPRPAGRGGVHERVQDPRARRCGRHVLRGRPFAERQASPTRPGPASAGSRSSRVLPSSRSRSSAPTRSATGRSSTSPRSRSSSASRSGSPPHTDTTRDQQQEAADYIFARIRELYEELQRVGHKGAQKAARARARRGGAAVARS